MVRRGALSSSKLSPLYRHVTSIDSHIDKVAHSLELVAFSKYSPPQARAAKRAVSAFVIALLVIYTFSPFLLKANTVLFYPTACLGGWVTPYHASGVPSEAKEYSAATSAVLPSNTHAELYCGSFTGEIPEGSTPKDTRLVIYWAAEHSTPEETVPAIEETVEIVSDDFSSSTQAILDAPIDDVTFTFATSTEESSGDTSVNEEAPVVPEEEKVEPPASEVKEEAAPIQEPTSEPEPAQEEVSTIPTEAPAEAAPTNSESENAPVSWFTIQKLISLFVLPVYAQEESVQQEVAVEVASQPVEPEVPQVTTVEITPAQEETATPAEEVAVPQEEIVIDTIKEEVSTESQEKELSTEPVTETPSAVPSLDIVEDTPVHPTIIEAERKEAERKEAVAPPIAEVLYTFDGVEWKTLTRVAAKDVNQQPLVIPYDVGTTWKNLQSLQIKIQSIQTFDEMPTLYVDAIELQIDYSKKYDTRIDSNEDAVAIDVDDVTGQKILLFGEEVVQGIKGVTPYLALVDIVTPQGRGLWMYDIENNKRLRVATSSQIDALSPLGLKDDYVFWLSASGTQAYAFDSKHRTYQIKEVKPFDVTQGERGEATFKDLPWKVIIGTDKFYFWKEETGEVFSDGNSEALDNFRKEFRLDEVLSDEEKDSIGIPTLTEESVVD